MPRRLVRNLLRALLACASSVVLGSLGFEGVSRMAGLSLSGIPAPGAAGDRGLWVYDATKGWFHAPGAQGTAFLGGPDAAAVRINRLRLRGREVERFPAAGIRRILVLGDSFAFGVGVDEDHTLAVVMGERLGRGYEVVNLGVSGYSTDQELILFEEVGARLKPSVVVLIMCDNDFEGNTQDFAYRAYYKPRFEWDGHRLTPRNVPVPELTRSERVRLWLARRSNTWKLLKRATARWPAAEALFDVARSRPSRPDVELTAALLAALRARVEDVGASLVVVNSGHPREDTPLFHRLRVLMRRDGVRFLGLEAAFSEARAIRPSANWDFGSDPHWNVDAHALAAERIAAFLGPRP